MTQKQVTEQELSGEEQGPEESLWEAAADIGQEEPEAESSPEQQPEEEFESFDPRYRDEFEGLLYIGALEREVELMGHRFVIRTLKSGEKLEVMSITREFEDSSLAYLRAYRAAVVAAALLTVDGQPLLVAKKSRGIIRQKYEYVINTWYDAVIDLLYEQVNQLEGRVIEILRELGAVGEQREVVQVEQPEEPGE